MKLKHVISGFALSFVMALGVGTTLEMNAKQVGVKAATTDTWSMIGSKSDWTNDVDFSWDADNKFYGESENGRFALSVSIAKNEQFKVRKDHSWDIDIGYGENTGQGIGTYLDNSSGNFLCKADGDYLITLKDGVASYEQKSYGFAICKTFHTTIKDGESTVKTHYYEDYNDGGYTLLYDRNSYHKDGYVLEGLYEEAGFENKVESGTVLTSQNTTLYAKYEVVVLNTYYLYDPRGLLELTDEDLPNIYAYNSNTDVNAPWPGVPMTKVSSKVWSCEVDACFANLIFNGQSSGNRQTVTITDRASHIGEYFVLTHRSNSGETTYGQWWTSTNSPYEVYNHTEKMVLEINTGLEDKTQCEFIIQNVNVNRNYPLDFYRGDTKILASQIYPDPGANAKVVTNYVYPHNNASNATICLKYHDTFYGLWVSGFEASYTYAINSGSNYEMYRTATPEEGYSEQYTGTVNVSKGDVITFTRESTAISTSKINIASGANLVKEEGSIKVHNDAELVLLTILKVNSSDTYEVRLNGFTETRYLEVKHSDTTTTRYNLITHSSSEYKTETEVPVLKGEILVIYIDDVIQTITAKAIGNNNCIDNSKGEVEVLLNMTATIYIDFNAGTCFCGGLHFGEFGMVVNDEFVRMTYSEHPIDPSFIEWKKIGYEFYQNDVIEFIDMTGTEGHHPHVFKVTKINEASTDGFEVVSGDLKYTAESSKTTDIYVKFKTDNDEVYFGSVTEDMAAAIKYAKAFNTSISGVCVEQGKTDVGALQSAWSNQATEFAKLIEAAQTVLKNATKDHDNDDIKAFASKYDFVYTHYTAELASYGANFAARSYSPSETNVSIGSNTTIDVTTAMIIISISTLVAVSSLAVICYIKKRKYHN